MHSCGRLHPPWTEPQTRQGPPQVTRACCWAKAGRSQGNVENFNNLSTKARSKYDKWLLEFEEVQGPAAPALAGTLEK